MYSKIKRQKRSINVGDMRVVSFDNEHIMTHVFIFIIAIIAKETAYVWPGVDEPVIVERHDVTVLVNDTIASIPMSELLEYSSSVSSLVVRNSICVPIVCKDR